MFAEPHGVCCGGCRILRTFGSKQQEGETATGPKQEILLQAGGIENNSCYIRSGSVKPLNPTAGQHLRQFGGKASEYMSVHTKFACFRLIGPFAFVFFLLAFAIDAQLGNRAGFQTGNADFIAALVANPESTIFHTPDCGTNLLDKLTLAVTDAQGESTVRFSSGSVCRIGKHLIAVCQFVKSSISILLGFFQHGLQKLTEIIEIFLFHTILLGMVHGSVNCKKRNGENHVASRYY
jgi:hypothetical protein